MLSGISDLHWETSLYHLLFCAAAGIGSACRFHFGKWRGCASILLGAAVSAFRRKRGTALFEEGCCSISEGRKEETKLN